VEALEFSAGDHVHVALFGRGIVREAWERPCTRGWSSSRRYARSRSIRRIPARLSWRS